MLKLGFIPERRSDSSTRYVNKRFKRRNCNQSNEDGMGMQHAPRDAEHTRHFAWGGGTIKWYVKKFSCYPYTSIILRMDNGRFKLWRHKHAREPI